MPLTSSDLLAKTAAASTTKIAEYLAAGLPVVCNAGVGDVDEVIEGDRVGVVLRDFDDESFARALREVEALRAEGNLARRARESAERRFDIERVGGAKYRRLYARLAASVSPGGSPAGAGGAAVVRSREAR